MKNKFKFDLKTPTTASIFQNFPQQPWCSWYKTLSITLKNLNNEVPHLGGLFCLDSHPRSIGEILTSVLPGTSSVMSHHGGVLEEQLYSIFMPLLQGGFLANMVEFNIVAIYPFSQAENELKPMVAFLQKMISLHGWVPGFLTSNALHCWCKRIRFKKVKNFASSYEMFLHPAPRCFCIRDGARMESHLWHIFKLPFPTSETI